VVVGSDVAAPLDAVASVLADPRAYDRMVVGGRRRILWFDPRWPATGSRFRHAVGLGPLTIGDQSEVLAGELPERLELAVGLGPAGALRVEFRLRPSGRGTRVEMAEEPRSGPVGRVWSMRLVPLERLVRRRNAVVLRHLGALAAERARIQSLDQSLDQDPYPDP
jgi:hypothetical protein